MEHPIEVGKTTSAVKPPNNVTHTFILCLSYIICLSFVEKLEVLLDCPLLRSLFSVRVEGSSGSLRVPLLILHVGSSPYRARNVPEGRHSVLVIAKRKGFFGSRVFNFEVEPEQKLELVLSEKVINGSLNGTIAVVMEVRNAVTSRNIHLMCSMGGARFFPCE